MLIGVGVVVILGGVLGGALAWGPLQRSRQLAAMDACRAGGRSEEGRQLAIAFATQWGAHSIHVHEAITGGRGPLAARIELCSAGGHVLLMAGMLHDQQLTPAERGQLCTSLVEVLSDTDLSTDKELMRALPAWALAADSEPALAAPALRLLVAIAGPDAQVQLARAAVSAVPSERALAAVLALCQVIERRGGGISSLLSILDGPQRAAVLSAPQVAECVRNSALPSDSSRLAILLGQADSLSLALAGLGGTRFHLADADQAGRAELSKHLLPYLTPTTADEALAGALLVVHHQRLIGTRTQVITLLPRLAQSRPPTLPADDLNDLLGRSLVNPTTPETTAAAEAMVTALTAALAVPETKSLAISALARVQFQNLAAVRVALDKLAECGPEGIAAVTLLVGKVYSREDIAKAGQTRGWAVVLADDRRKRARFDAIGQWLSDHAEETTARTTAKVMAANKAELGKMRDELQGWIDTKQPTPIGVTTKDLEHCAENVRLMLSSVIKATH